MRAVAFGPAGDVVASGGDDGRARLWDAATGDPLGAVLAHGGPVTAVSFAPAGRRLLTGSEDGIARLWTPPAPFPDHFSEDALQAAAEALTGTQLREDGIAVILPPKDWRDRRAEAAQAGLLTEVAARVSGR